MKKLSKGLYVILIIMTLLSITSMQNVAAAGPPDEDDVDKEVDDDKTVFQLRANTKNTYRFRERTMLTIRSRVNGTMEIECEAKKIGDKSFEIEIDGENDLEMEMTCTEEQSEKGLLNGETVQTRSRNRYTYRNGFSISIDCNDSCDAKLMMEETDENEGGTWAYYDKSKEEWVPVDTEEKDGYLVAETDHFSTWTVLTPEEDYTLIIIIGVGIGVGAIVAVVVIIKKKRN